MNKKAILGLIGTVGILSLGTVISLADNKMDITLNDNELTIQEEVNDVINQIDFRTEELMMNGILIGDENGDLQLGSTLKRQEMVVLISRLMGKEEEAKNWDVSALTFEDVEKNNWAAPYIAWAKDNNITKGYSEEWFGYNDELTEVQTVIFLLRVLGYNEASQENASILAYENAGMIINYKELNNEAIIRKNVVNLLYNTLYSKMNNSESKLAENLGIIQLYEESEREIAMLSAEYGIEYKDMIDSEDWKIIYLDFNNINIEKEMILENIGLYSSIGSQIGFKPYVLVDINTEKQIIVTFFEESSIMYQIKLDDEIVFNNSSFIK